MCIAIVPGTSAIPCIHPYFRKQRSGCTQQAQLIQLSLSSVCSRGGLHPSPISICESPARRSIFVHHAEKLVPLCQLFHSLASSRPDLVGLSSLQSWLDAKWTPFGSKLKDDKLYRDEFLAPDDAAFVFFLVRGTPALICIPQWKAVYSSWCTRSGFARNP
jgi:hypothetical protein